MNTYMKKSPIYHAIVIRGYQNKFGWYLCAETEDELMEFEHEEGRSGLQGQVRGSQAQPSLERQDW